MTLAKPMAQLKDFSRKRPRPLDSLHGACSLEQAGTDRLFILAGSVLGARHDQAGVTREDDVAFAVDPTANSPVLAAVADGLGSARLAHVASALAVRRAVELLSSWLLAEPGDGGITGSPAWPQVAARLVAALADLLIEERITARSGELGMPPAGAESRNRSKMPATTLAVLVVDHRSRGIHASWFTVGDCQVAIADITTGAVEWLTPVEHQDDQRTAAMPSTQKVSYCGQHLIDDGQAVLAMTDGMAELLLAAPEHVLRALATAQERGNALSDLLVALDLRLQGAHDDRSMVAVGPIRRDRR